MPLLCTDSWLAHCGCTGSPLPCYRLRGSPACAGATADGSLRWATAESPIPCISLTQMATGGSSHPEAARHVGLAADVWLGRYMRAVSFGWANVRLFAHRCACHSTLFGDLTDLTGILPVQRLIGLTVRPSLPPRAARGGQLGAALCAHTRPCTRRKQINGGFCGAEVYLAWLQRELVDATGRRRRRRCDWAFEFDRQRRGQITINR